MKLDDLTGRRFGRLTVKRISIEYLESNPQVKVKLSEGVEETNKG